jgi:hypothetical protein
VGLRIQALVLSLLASAPVLAEPVSAEVSARIISNFKIGSSETRFGALEFNGGLELSSDNVNFGSVSALRFLGAGGRMLSVSDNGFWITGTIEHDADMHPSGFSGVAITEMADSAGAIIEDKDLSDAEGLIVDGDQVSVSFERMHRISTGVLDYSTMRFPYKNESLPVPAKELRSNRGFETLAKSPVGTPLDGARVAIAEKSLDKQGNIFGGVMEGPQKGRFTVSRDSTYDISDGDFLPNGDLLILERRFSMAEGIGMRIRQIKGADIKPGAVLNGEVLMEADLAYQIDNMEALDVWQRQDGATMISLMSDDNHSILQRTMYLEFRLPN